MNTPKSFVCLAHPVSRPVPSMYETLSTNTGRKNEYDISRTPAKFSARVRTIYWSSHVQSTSS